MRIPVTVNSLQHWMSASRLNAITTRYLITKYKEIPQLFSVNGWLREDIPNMAAHKLKPFEQQLHKIWQGPTNIPRGTEYEAMCAANILLETFGVEHIDIVDHGTLMYCNTGDSYVNTLCHFKDKKQNIFYIGSPADFQEEVERTTTRIQNERI